MTTPALPENIDPNEPHVEFQAYQCRTCGEMGPTVNMADKSDPRHRWSADHLAATGHSDSYVWTLRRNTSQTFPLPTLRRAARRPLGKRGQ